MDWILPGFFGKKSPLPLYEAAKMINWASPE
jgi:hypothetical protein